MYYGGPRTSGIAGRVHVEDKRASTKWRVCSSRPLPVSSDADERKGEIICDLEPRSTCDVSAQETLPDGSVRFQIIDPVWRGWLTFKKGEWGLATLEPLDAPSEASARIAASGEPAAAPAAAPAAEPLPLEWLQDLQA
eukprot:2773119-Prymnesium_polylepis.1